MRRPEDIKTPGGTLADTLRLHQQWGAGVAGGMCANLGGADLDGVCGNMREIKSMHVELWPVAWTMSPEGEAWLQIGCQRHPVEKWRRGCDSWIESMDQDALEWWGRWKEPLLAMVDMSPAVPWGKDTSDD